MLPPLADRPKLEAVLGQLVGAVEELVLGGLTTASETTRQTVAVATAEAARFRLLRLGSALRATADELGRFAAHDPAFSRRRLLFFLNRSWLLGRGLSHALRTGDEAGFDRLNWTPPTVPLPAADVVCLGVVKKVTAAAVLFEFRLRAVADAPPVAAGQRLTWSAVFPVKPGANVPAEGYLHLPQKQKFAPTVFLDKKVVSVRGANLAADAGGGGRVSLGDATAVTAGSAFTDWGRFLAWSPGPAAERVKAHTPGPLDLETELQEEVVVRDYDLGPPADGDEPGQLVYPLAAGRLSFHAVVGAGAEGKALAKSLEAVRKLKTGRPPLFGLMHPERCRLVFQPLSALGPDGPDYLTLSKDVVDKAALLKTMSFK